MDALCGARKPLGIVAGIAVGIAAMFVTNGMRAVVLGSLAAAAIAGLQQVETAVVVGSFTGTGLGLFLVARGERFFAA